jgi:hypothetical protein
MKLLKFKKLLSVYICYNRFPSLRIWKVKSLEGIPIQSRQSAKVFSSRPNWDPPPHNTQASAFLPPPLWYRGRVWGAPFPTRGTGIVVL